MATEGKNLFRFENEKEEKGEVRGKNVVLLSGEGK